MIIPNLSTNDLNNGYYIEKVILNQVATIEAWFRHFWQKTPAPITSSVDLRNSGFKLAPVDTNLFPAGFNNLNKDFLSLCVQALQAYLSETIPYCTKILIIPENHTRNQFYLESLKILRDIFVRAGFVVHIGSIDKTLEKPLEFTTDSGEILVIEPVQIIDNKIRIGDFTPCAIVLNNDLSSDTPEYLKTIKQPILSPPALGWASRLKSSHFKFYNDVVDEFAKLINIDPWLINPYFSAATNIDFMNKTGLEELAHNTDTLLNKIKLKYQENNIKDKPFVAIKADNGTYGMSVIMVQDAQEIINLNRKQRTRMSTAKGGVKVNHVIIQEGIYTFETMPNDAVAEPVVYMIGQFVVGGFYRVHKGRGKADNLNAPGMQFAPLAFSEACNVPHKGLEISACPNRFYVYGVIARLASCAAALEIANA